MQLNSVPLDNALVESSEESVLVDTVYPGELLVISFGFVAWDKRPDFDFYGRLKKLENTVGKPMNRILVRDCRNSWYHREIPGLGHHVDEVADSLKQMIAAIKPSRVITIGQSMGGYAAVLYGTLLEVDRILAFGPLSFFCPKQAITYHDRRWLSIMMDIEQNPPPVRYTDLPALRRQMDSRSELHVVYGTLPDVNATESVNLDVLHAMRYGALPNTYLHPVPESGHAVVKHLIDAGQINDLLQQHIMGGDVALPVSSQPLPADWIGWLQENLALNIPPQELLGVLRQHGFSEYEGRVALFQCGRNF